MVQAALLGMPQNNQGLTVDWSLAVQDIKYDISGAEAIPDMQDLQSVYVI